MDTREWDHEVTGNAPAATAIATGGIHLLVDDDRNLVLENGTGSATGVRVPIFAIGPGAERFGGLIDNDEVGRALLDLLRAARAVRPNPDERP